MHSYICLFIIIDKLIWDMHVFVVHNSEKQQAHMRKGLVIRRTFVCVCVFWK